MNIPESAIEAARNARVSAGDVDDYAREHGIDYMEALWRIKLEAAAPSVAAHAWDRGYDCGQNDVHENDESLKNGGPSTYTRNPYKEEA